MTLTSIATDLGLFKAGMDALKSTISTARGLADLLPAKDRGKVADAIDKSERDIRAAEAQIAVALGFPLCRCSFPGTPMVKVGTRLGMAEVEGKLLQCMIDVHRCPTCDSIDMPAGGGYNPLGRSGRNNVVLT